MVTTLFENGVRLVSRFATAFEQFFDFFFFTPVSDLLTDWRDAHLNVGGVLQPLYDWLTDAVINIPLFTDNSLADLVLGAGITALIGFTIVRSLLSIIR